jgi:hypothetical protein
MYQMKGTSRLLTHDEILPVLREGGLDDGSVVYVDGKPVKRAPLTFSIRCNVQPMSGRDLMRVPEADRFREQYSLWTYDVRLRVNDKLLRLGAVYNVEASEPWGRYVKARMLQVDVGPDYAPRFDVTGTEKWSLGANSVTLP